jgi:two-component system, OmpR family, response regulator
MPPVKKDSMPIKIQPLSTESFVPGERDGPVLASSMVQRGRGVAAQAQSERVNGHPLRVLLVEDSDLLVQRISELVADLPNVELAGTAASECDAIAALQRGEIDVVILDLQLQVGSGFGVLRTMNRWASRPSVIIFTNFAIGAYRDTALALGAEHFLDKSREYDRLPAVLQQLSEALH